MSPSPLKPSPAPGVAMVGIDWGTTHRRCYRLGHAGSLQAEHADDLGLLAASAPSSAARNQPGPLVASSPSLSAPSACNVPRAPRR